MSINKINLRDAVGTTLAVWFVAAGLAGTACKSGQSIFTNETRQSFCDYAGLKLNK